MPVRYPDEQKLTLSQKVDSFIYEDKNIPALILSVLQYHNCFGPPFLFVEGLLSTGPTPSSFYLLLEMGLPLHLFPAYM